MDRVVFIPFEQPMAHEFLERTNSWVQERPFDALGDKHFLQASKSVRASDARKKF